MVQYFKGDETEIKFFNCIDPIATILSEQKSDFFDQALTCYILGQVLYDTGRAPLANAIPRSIFAESFAGIFNAFLSAGSFESYLTVFRSIFGDDVEVEFTVPAPGKLQIDIQATGLVLFDFVSKYVMDNNYVYDEIIDDAGDNIAFQSIKGLESQYEVEQMLFELVPAGIYTEITLTIGES